MEWIYLACFLFIVITLMFVVYLLIKIDLVLAMLDSLVEKLDAELPEPQDTMNLMLLKAKNRSKTRRFTDKSRDFLAARDRESRR